MFINSRGMSAVAKDNAINTKTKMFSKKDANAIYISLWIMTNLKRARIYKQS